MSTLKEIAADLGVSHGLVSSVLNNRMGNVRVSERVRKKIIQRAQDLDYQPNQSAIALKRGNKGVVGVFMHGVGVEGSDLMLNFVRVAGKVLSDNRINLWLQFFETDEQFREICTERLLRRIDGLILTGLPHTQLIGMFREISHKGLHLVTACHGGIQYPDVANFQVNHERQCHITTRHLIERGCRRIAHFYISPYKYAGFLKAHAEMEVRIHHELVLQTTRYDIRTARDLTHQLLRSGKQFDGLVGQSDAHIVGAMHALTEAGIPLEKWPLMTGVDDSPIARESGLLPITSASGEMETCARLSVEAIVKKLEGKDVLSCMVEPKLVVRESTSRPLPVLDGP